MRIDFYAYLVAATCPCQYNVPIDLLLPAMWKGRQPLVFLHMDKVVFKACISFFLQSKYPVCIAAPVHVCITRARTTLKVKTI